jgi:hypothetical protein
MTLVDTDLEFAAGHHLEQFVGHLLRDLARRNVREQGLARHVDRALGRQQRRRGYTGS